MRWGTVSDFGLIMFFGSVLGIVLTMIYELKYAFVNVSYDIFIFVTNWPYGTLITTGIIGFLLAFPKIAYDMGEIDDRP